MNTDVSEVFEEVKRIDRNITPIDWQFPESAYNELNKDENEKKQKIISLKKTLKEDVIDKIYQKISDKVSKDYSEETKTSNTALNKLKRKYGDDNVTSKDLTHEYKKHVANKYGGKSRRRRVRRRKTNKKKTRKAKKKATKKKRKGNKKRKTRSRTRRKH